MRSKGSVKSSFMVNVLRAHVPLVLPFDIDSPGMVIIKSLEHNYDYSRERDNASGRLVPPRKLTMNRTSKI